MLSVDAGDLQAVLEAFGIRRRERPFSGVELSMIPHIYAVITAFWTDQDGIAPLHKIEERMKRDLTINLQRCPVL